jgi:hypothetical protein
MNKELLDELTERFSKRTSRIYEGRNRRVFVFKGYVVKVPMNEGGMTDNDWEGSVSNGPRPLREWSVVYPKTRLVWHDDVPILFMERVIPVTSKRIRARLKKVPRWVGCVDCGQVGFTKDGRLVAYDYGVR